MRSIWLKTVFFLSILSGLTSVWAQNTPTALINPATQLQNMVNVIQHDVAQNRASLQKDPAQLYQLVQQDLVPNMAIQQMAAMTLGSKWANATPDQRSAFITQFSIMLTRAYAAALLKVDQYTIVIYPLRSNTWQTSSQVALPGAIYDQASGGEPSNVTYYVVRNGNQWAIYDFAIEGVSIIQNFQAQLQSFPNIQAVIDRITQLNNQNL